MEKAEGTHGKSTGRTIIGGKRKALLLVLLMAAALAAVYLTPLRNLHKHVQEINAYLRMAGWAAPAVFVAGTAALVAVGFPRLALCLLSGLAFSFGWGFLWAQIGTVIGSYSTFLFVRWGGREFALRKWRWLAKGSLVVSANGILWVVLARQVPINGFCTTSLLGLTHVKHRDFLIGTAIGIIPEAIPATLIGASATGSSTRAIYYIIAGILWFIVAGFVIRWYLKSQRFSAGKAEKAELANLMEIEENAENQGQ